MANYEQMTFSFIMARALARVPATVDKREGSIIYDALAPACYELAEIYMELDNVLKQTYASTSSGDFLTLRAAELGVIRRDASAAIRKGVFNIAVPLGSRFSIQNVTYYVDSLILGTEYKLICETAGVIGNQHSGNLIPIEYIAGLTSATITDILIPGEDEESDSQLRNRYFDSLQVASFGGNITDYKEKVNDLDGVGGVKVYPHASGGGTVTIVIVDSDYNVPSSTLIDDVQTAIDPLANQGLGYGIAPIGHLVTIQGVTSLAINVSATITLQIGYNWSQVEPYVIANLEEYLLSLREIWDYESSLIVRVSQIEAKILASVGVLDVSGVQLNGAAANIVLDANVIPIFGTITKV